MARAKRTAQKSVSWINNHSTSLKKIVSFRNFLDSFESNDSSEEESSDGDSSDSKFLWLASDFSPLTGVVPALTKTAPATEVTLSRDAKDAEQDKETVMEVDGQTLRGLLAVLLSNPMKIKVRRAIYLLRGLLRDQIQSGSIHSAPVPLPSDGEDSLTMEEHLRLVVRCSSLLSKYFLVYKGRELEKQMVELDELLRGREELFNSGIVQNLSTESDIVRIDKEVAAVGHGDHSELLNRGQGTIGDERVEKLAGTMEDPPADTVTRQPLTPEDTILDLSSVPPTTVSTGSEGSGTIQPATRLMASMLRNLADLLDCTCDNTKGKGRALDMAGSATIKTLYDLWLVGPLLNEFKSMNEEMRKNQQRREIESIARQHWAEPISLKEQTRVTDKYRGETELSRKRHREDMDSLMGSVHRAKKQRVTEVEGTPLLEMSELRRRITALERHTRSLTHSPSQADRPYSLPVYEDVSNKAISHPLGHLFD